MNKVLILVFAFFAVSTTVSAQSEKKHTKAIASYYSAKFNGRKTATGDTYWDHLKTAASNVYKLGTRLRVTNPHTGKSVKVVVNDRMSPRIKGRVDLSKSAFKEIAALSRGIVPVHVEVLGDHHEDENAVM